MSLKSSAYNIKIFIISFNRESVLKESIESYQRFFKNKDIYIIDKLSTYEPLKEYYKRLEKSGITVIYSEPMTSGPSGPGGLNDLYKEINKYKNNCDYYVVTDPDISIKGCKKDLLEVYASLLDEYPNIDIVGPMLTIDDIPYDYPAREICFVLHRRQFWKKKPCHLTVNGKGIYVQKAPIDSTFGMVRGNVSYKRLMTGFRTYHPYDAKHLDWYITPENMAEDQHSYLKNHSDNKISHWGTKLFKRQPNFNELSGENRKIFTTRSRFGRIQLVSKYLTKSPSDDSQTKREGPRKIPIDPAYYKKLSASDVNSIRDMATSLENVDIKVSLALMSLALKARPRGPFIKQKVEEYKKYMAPKNKVINQIPLFYYSKVLNFGDLLNVYMVEKLSNNKILAITPSSYNAKHYLVIGSILSAANENSHIWGAGLMFENSKMNYKPMKVHAVRGPRTRALLLKNNIDCPEVYGDPALLLPKLYSPKINKKYKLGVIAHYVDKNNPWVKSLATCDGVKIIDIQNSDIESFVDELLECEKIVSSSLHGIIVGDAYGIPAMWIELSNKVAGSGFKFLDYFESVKRVPQQSKILNKSIDINEVLAQFNDYSIDIDLELLLQTCPFYENIN